MSKIKDFRDFDAWSKGHELAIKIYKITKNYPNDERFGLVDQMRRAVVSVTSNVAEGFGRFGVKDKQQFYVYAQASLLELQSQIIISKDLEYIAELEFEDLFESSVDSLKVLRGAIRSNKARGESTSS